VTPFPTQSNVLAALRSFLLAALPAGVDVVAAQANRVPEPSAPSFVVMTPLRDVRLATNVDAYLDVRFTGSLAGTVLTVSSVAFGSIVQGAALFGVGVLDGTTIASQTSGTTGGAGVYVVSRAQTLPSRTLASGAKTVTEEVEVSVQIDFHSADLSGGGDMARVVSALFRDEFAAAQFAGQSPNYGVSPLHADDPRQAPFVNAEQQYEWRWTVEALLQANVVVSVPQQFADSLAVQPINVDAAYPP
jgi:hypothetical protein